MSLLQDLFLNIHKKEVLLSKISNLTHLGPHRHIDRYCTEENVSITGPDNSIVIRKGQLQLPMKFVGNPVVMTILENTDEQRQYYVNQFKSIQPDLNGFILGELLKTEVLLMG